MSWTDYTTSLANSGFSGACIIDRSTYAVLAQHGDAIPRGYQVDGSDVNENTYLAATWNVPDFTSVRFNQVKYMILRKEDDDSFALGKKGQQGIFLYKLKTIFLIGVSDNDKITMENASNAIGKMFDALKTAQV